MRKFKKRKGESWRRKNIPNVPLFCCSFNNNYKQLVDNMLVQKVVFRLIAQFSKQVFMRIIVFFRELSHCHKNLSLRLGPPLHIYFFELPRNGLDQDEQNFTLCVQMFSGLYCTFRGEGTWRKYEHFFVKLGPSST